MVLGLFVNRWDLGPQVGAVGLVLARAECLIQWGPRCHLESYQLRAQALESA